MNDLYFHNNPLPMWVYDLETYQFLDVNHAAVHHYGYSVDEFRSMTIKDIRPPDDVNRLIQNIQNVTQGIDEAGIWRHLKKDGTTIYVEITSHTMQYNGHRAELVVAIDMTERVNATQALRESEDRFRDLVEHSYDLIGTHDLNGHILSINTAATNLLGIEPEFLLEKNLIEILTPEARDRFGDYLAAIQRDGKAWGLTLVQTKSGEKRIWEYNNTLRVEGVSQPVVRALGRDITERVRAEKALRESQATLASVVNSAMDAIISIGEDQRILLFNHAAEKMFRCSAREAIGQPLDRFIPEPYRAAHRDYVNHYGQTGKTKRNMGHLGMIYGLRINGEKFPLEASISHTLSDGKQLYTVILRDITERVHSDKKLRESEERYRNIFMNATEGIFQSTPQGRYLSVNPAMAEIYGYASPQEMLTSITSIATQIYVDPGKRKEFQHRLQCDGRVVGFETENLRKDRKRIWILSNARAVCDTDGSLLYYEGTVQDITERKQTEKALQESEERYRNIFNGVQDAIFVESLDGKILAVNNRACEMYGYTREEFRGKIVTDLVPKGHPILMATGEEISPLPVETVNLRSNGEHFPIEISGRVQTINGEEVLVIIVRDISERKQAEEALLHRTEELSALYDTMQDLVGEQELSLLLQKIAERAAGLLRAPAAGIYLYDANTKEMEVRIATDHSIPIGTRLGLGEGMAGRVAQTRQPLIVDDYRSWEGISPKYRGTQVSAVVEVPMIFAGELVGVLVVQELSTTRRKFTEADAHLLLLFATQIAGAVRNARLFEEEQRRRLEAETLRQTTSALTSSLDLNQVLERLLDSLSPVIPFESAAVFLSENGHVQGMAGRGWPDNVPVIDQIFSTDSPLFQEVACLRRPFVLSDVDSDPRFSGWADTRQVRSWMGVPLIAHDNIIGILTIDSLDTATYNDSHADFAFAIANQAAVAIENARLYTETLQRNRELQALAEISAALRVAGSQSEMLSILLDYIISVTTAEGTAIAMRDPVSGDTLIELARGGWEEWTGIRLPPGVGISGRVIASGQPYISKNVSADPHMTHPALIRSLRAAACLPLIIQEHTIGALWIGHTNTIASEEIHLLTAISEMAASAIHRSSLHELTERQLYRLAALRAIDNTINSVMDKRETLDKVLEHIIAQLGVDAGVILLLDTETQVLAYASGQGFHTDGITYSRLGMREGLAGRVAHEREFAYVNDLETSEHFLRKSLLSGEGFVSYYGVPLIAKGQVKGVLELFHRSRFNLSDDWQDFCETLVGQAAIAIDNAEMFEGLQHSNLELSHAYGATIEGWSAALDLRDEDTEGHTQRVTELTMRLGREMGMNEVELVHIRRGALLHDIGKIAVSDKILHKPGPLSEDEMEIVRKHPVHAYNLLSPIAYLKPALDIPYCHHEKWDGSGYPRGLKGTEIPLAARMFAIVDVWDALISDRPYRKAWSRKQALAYVEKQAGTHFDPGIVQVFLNLVKNWKRQERTE